MVVCHGSSSLGMGVRLKCYNCGGGECWFHLRKDGSLL